MVKCIQNSRGQNEKHSHKKIETLTPEQSSVLCIANANRNREHFYTNDMNQKREKKRNNKRARIHKKKLNAIIN